MLLESTLHASPTAWQKSALKLGVYRKLDPTPLEEFIFFDHPSGRARIRMAMDWKAANLPAGESHASEKPTCHSLTSYPIRRRPPPPLSRSRGCCEGAAAVKANLRFRINIKFRM